MVTEKIERQVIETTAAFQSEVLRKLRSIVLSCGVIAGTCVYFAFKAIFS
jgi:hypothetical protein